MICSNSHLFLSSITIINHYLMRGTAFHKKISLQLYNIYKNLRFCHGLGYRNIENPSHGTSNSLLSQEFAKLNYSSKNARYALFAGKACYIFIWHMHSSRLSGLFWSNTQLVLRKTVLYWLSSLCTETGICYKKWVPATSSGFLLPNGFCVINVKKRHVIRKTGRRRCLS